MNQALALRMSLPPACVITELRREMSSRSFAKAALAVTAIGGLAALIFSKRRKSKACSGAGGSCAESKQGESKTTPAAQPVMVSAEWLKDRLGAVKILDCSWFLPSAKRDPELEHQTLRIPGSRFFNIDKVASTLMVEGQPMPHMLPSAEVPRLCLHAVAAACSRAGLRSVTGFLCCPRGNGCVCGRYRCRVRRLRRLLCLGARVVDVPGDLWNC